MKVHIVAVLGLALGTLALSGCSISGSSSPDGGVYKSTDGGQTFAQKAKINDKENIGNANVVSMAIDPKNPDTIYLGTENAGIFRSTNGGETWIRDVNNFLNVNSIVIDPTSSQTLYIAVNRGGRGKVLKTTNGGESWEEIFTERVDGPLVLSLAVNKSNPQIIYAGDNKGGVYRSEDGGTTWANIYWAGSGIRKIVFDSANQNIIYLGTISNGLLRSDDGGGRFSVVPISIQTQTTMANGVPSQPTSSTAGGYIYSLIVHPSRGGVIFVSTKNGIFKSFDNGRSWQQINTLLKPEEITARGVAINPQNDNELYFASGKAFYKTTNGGRSWLPVQFNVSRTINIIELNPSDPNIIYLGMSAAETGGGWLPF